MELITRWKRAGVFIAGSLLIGIHYAIFSQFFPNSNGTLGHDYSYFLPSLLDGYFWYSVNGIFSIPWFTPSFCGGVPNFPNPQNTFFSIPQFLTIFVNPLESVKMTLLIFAAIGFWGFYFLLKDIFHSGRMTAILGAALFLFNGFFSHRMLIGHLTFHLFMIFPVIAYFILNRSGGPVGKLHRGAITDISIAGFLISMIIFSGGFQLLFQIVYALFAFLVIYLMARKGEGDATALILKLFSSLILAFFLSSPRWLASIYYVNNVPRTLYPLPGIPDFSSLSAVLLKSLFWEPADKLARFSMVNYRWILERHEFEFGITVVPALILIAVAFKSLFNMYKWKALPVIGKRELAYAGILAAMMLFPLLLNYYSPAWNAILKSVPVLKNFNNNFRWFCVYIPTIILAASILFERFEMPEKLKTGIILLCLAVIAGSNIGEDREFYKSQQYIFPEIIESYDNVKAETWSPVITNIIVLMGKDGKMIRPVHRNNYLTQGFSFLECYEPMFGYFLENFPLKQLHPGHVTDNVDGAYNVKNPACYVFPEENGCSPGDHLKEGEEQEAEKFLSFKEYDFRISTAQKAANFSSLVLHLLLIFYLATVSILAVRKVEPERGSKGMDQ